MPDITEPMDQTPEVICVPTTPPAKTPGADTNTLPRNVILLQEDMKRAMGCLLMARLSLDALWWKQVLDFEMALHWNEAKATEAIREANAHCGATIREAESHHTTHIREAEANYTSIIMEAEAHYTADIRKVESHCVEHTCSIQQLHAQGMQCLETEAMEEGRDCLCFLTTCGMALQACSLEACGVLMGPLHLLMGNMSLATLLNIPPQVSSTREESTLVISCATTPVAPGPSSGTKRWHYLPDQTVSSPQSGDEAVGTSEEPLHLRWKDKMPFTISLKGSQQEGFAKDSDLVWQAREDYFKTNCPHFNFETLHDLSDVFQDMIAYGDLLGSQIYEILEVWMGQEDLQYADDALKTLPKCLQFFQPVSPKESLKVMRLTGVHNLDAICHFAGVTFCLWCGKKGQNEGNF